MLACQHDYVAKMKQGRTPEATEAARRLDQASHARLNKLRSLAHNSTCFDCSALKPGWAVLPHGIFVCIDCAQVHRNLGRHISQTKAINTGTYLWFPHEIQVMEEVGNAVAAQAFNKIDGLPPKPFANAPAADKQAYAKAKYGSGVPADFVQAKAATMEQSMQRPSISQKPACPHASHLSHHVHVAKPTLKGAIRVPLTTTETTLNARTSPEIDLICFDEPVAQTSKPMPFSTNMQGKSQDFFAAFGL